MKNQLFLSSLVFRSLVFATILQLVGLTAISIGLGVFSLPLGIVAAGASALLVGLAIEKG